MAKYGAGMPNRRPSNNSGGATQAKTGKQYTPLCRQSGFNTAMDAMTNRRGSQYPHASMHFQYEGISKDQGGNILGWSPE